MLYSNRIFKLIITIESIIISAMIPIQALIPAHNKIFRIMEFPINFQIPVIIFLTIIFSGELLITAFSIYLLIGLFVMPVFSDGGSLGYLLTPNFGYLLGIYPLINIIKLLNRDKKIRISSFLKKGLKAISVMHITGVLYLSILFILFNKQHLILYNIGLFSLSKIPFQLLTFIPLIIILRIFKRI